MIRLTEGEWAILEVLWSGERFPLGEIVSALRPKMNWRRNTVHTYLTRMESKGLVKIHRETEPHQYAAAAADVFLTHCGMNSVSEALFFGVPLVCCPQTQEQRGVANRVLALGAGLLLPDDSPQAIAQAIGIALSDPGYRAHAATIAQSFRESGGAPQAAETILQVIAQDRATGT